MGANIWLARLAQYWTNERQGIGTGTGTDSNGCTSLCKQRLRGGSSDLWLWSGQRPVNRNLEIRTPRTGAGLVDLLGSGSVIRR
jgi:hypothetical protein